LKNKDELLALLQSPQSPPESVTYAFSHLYISAESDHHVAEVVKIFYENHPKIARSFFAGIDIPEHWLPENFSFAGYLP